MGLRSKENSLKLNKKNKKFKKEDNNVRILTRKLFSLRKRRRNMVLMLLKLMLSMHKVSKKLN